MSQNENTAPLWQRGAQPCAWLTFLRVEVLMIIYSTQDTLIPLVWVTGPIEETHPGLQMKKDG